MEGQFEDRRDKFLRLLDSYAQQVKDFSEYANTITITIAIDITITTTNTFTIPTFTITVMMILSQIR